MPYSFLYSLRLLHPASVLHRYALLLLLLVVPGLVAAAPLPAPSDSVRRQQVALVLSGGGAKGAAHIGVLYALQQQGIPIDMVVGTSMGANIGALYAMGYTVEQLDTLMRHSDWDFLMSDRAPRTSLSPEQRARAERYVLDFSLTKPGKPELGGWVKGRNLGNELAKLTVGYHDSISFDTLPVRFACVATNLVNGTEVDFHSGVLAKVVRASMAVPGILAPVQLHGMSLADGGLVNNYPVDVAKRMGADIVIGVTLQREFEDSVPVTSVQGVLSQYVSISCRDKMAENIRMSDLHLSIDCRGCGTMDFSPAAIDTMMRRGYEAALSHADVLAHIRQRLGLDSVPQKQPRPLRFALNANPVYHIREVLFNEVNTYEERTLRRDCRLYNNADISLLQIEEAVHLLGEKYQYQQVNYALSPADGGRYDLVLYAASRSKGNVSLGARFDTEELAALLVDARFVLHTHVPTHAEVTARLSQQYTVGGQFVVEPSLGRQFSFFYDYRHHDTDYRYKGKKYFSAICQEQSTGLQFATHRLHKLDFVVGLRLDRYDFSDIMVATGKERPLGLHSDNYFVAYAGLEYNSFNQNYYPSRGQRFSVHYAFTTDNLSHLTKPHAFSTVSAMWRGVVPLSARFALLPAVQGRMLFGRDVPFVYGNLLGGLMAGRQYPQQVPFVGLREVEPVRDALVNLALNLRYHIGGHHYATLLTALASEADEIQRIPGGHYLYGVGLQYGYNTKFGPIEATLAYSGHCTKPLLYISMGFDF